MSNTHEVCALRMHADAQRTQRPRHTFGKKMLEPRAFSGFMAQNWFCSTAHNLCSSAQLQCGPGHGERTLLRQGQLDKWLAIQACLGLVAADEAACVHKDAAGDARQLRELDGIKRNQARLNDPQRRREYRATARAAIGDS